ncbi:Cadherin domain protein, partial [Rhodopirellula sallentina SM41]
MAESAESATVLQVEVESTSSDDTHADENASIQTVAEPSTQMSPREIIVIDSSVADLQALLDDLEQNRSDADVYVLDSDRDGVEQISDILEGRGDVASLHIVSHSEDGRIQLGETWLGESNLDAYAGGIASWESSLSSDADILFYGCDLADSVSGQTLIDSIGALTGADVAASDDDTGYAGYGGDWQFEYHVGVIESDVAFSVELQNTWQHKLASLTINVDTFSDVVDGGDGVTSLREAIIQANANVGGDTTINLLAGTYTRTLNAAGEDNAATGDLDVHEDVTIVGAGSGLTIIDAGYNDRVFDVHDGHLTMSDLTVTAGVASTGGGAVSVNDAAASLTLERVIVTDNGASEGGAISNLGTINLTDVEISNNGGTGSTVKGGGIFNEGTAILERVTMSGNAAGSGGAIYNDTLPSLSLTNVTISGNTAASSGGAIYNNNSTLTIVNSTITLNNADSGGGLRMQGATSPTLLNTIVAGNSVASANADIEGTISSLGNNLIGDTTGGSGFVGSDLTNVSASLEVLADNGGYVQTHALTAGSLAHNAGAVSGASATDGRNVARDASPDIGAFEAAGTTFTVTNTADSGAGSLRQAILDANASVGADTIEFNISGTGVHVIAPTSVLPTITEAVTIDATTDDSFAANGNRPAIVLSGVDSVGGSGDGLTLSGTSDGSTIRGLIIRQWSGDGIEIQIGSDNNLIVGNYIGQLDNTGTSGGGGTGNGGNGIVVYGASNQIGGATSADQNILSGNTSAGVYITGSSATDNDVIGNLIGVDSSGVTALGNSVAGVLINAGANGNTIGGEGLGNVISGNTNGVQIFDGGTSSNTVQGNFIGVDATATVAVGNTAQGIQIGSGASNNQIGGDSAAKANVIGGNGTSGIEITDAGTSSNHVQGNYIGTNSAGSLDLGNAIHGMRIQSSAMDNVIGGTEVGEGNVIAFNTTHGVSIVSGATGNALLGNSIYDNDDLAIDLNDDAVSVNDTDDVDSGPNNLLNYPIITSVVQNGADLEIEFSVDLSSGSYRIEFFENPSGVGVDGHGEGETYLGTTTIVTSSVSGGEQFTATLTGVTATSIVGVTATATEDRGGGYYGSTSEFSAAFMTAAQFDDSDEVRVNDTTSGDQTTEAETRGSNQAVAVSANGDYVVVWTSDNQDGDGKAVYAQRFNAAGVALTGEIQVNQTTSDDQQWARVDAADDGSFVVTWTLVIEGDPVDVYARRFGADGTALGNEFVVNTYVTGEQHNSSIAVNASGEFIIVWEGKGASDDDGIYYRRFNADGTTIDAAQVRVNVDDLDSETTPDVAMNDSGQFAVVWQADGEIYVRHYDVDGSNVATAMHNDLMVDTTIAAANGPSIAMDESGRTVVVYRTPGLVGAGAGVWAKTFELSGDVRHALFEPSDESFSSDNTSPSVDMDDHGNFVVVYHGDSDGDGSGASVKYRIYDEDANALMSAEQVNVTTSGDQQYASISMLDANNFVVVWSGNGNQTDQVDSSGVFSRQFSFAPAEIDLDANDSSAAGRNYNATFTIGSGSVVVVDSDATVTQGDDANIDSLTVILDGILDGTDEVLAVDTTGTGITASYADGVLTLSGSDTVANYQQVLRTITYDNTAGSPTVGSRTLTFHARAGVTFSTAAVTNLTVQTPPNQIPTIDSGGPYTIEEGGTLNLDASGSDDLDGDTLSFAWDMDNDGNYGEASEPTSAAVSLDWATLQGLGMGDDGVYTIGLQIDDGKGGVVTTTTTVTVTNVAPTLTVNGSTTISSGAVYFLGLDATDFGDDTISHWTVNWGDGTIETVVGDPSTVSHTYAVSGLTHNITVSATDEDGTWHDSELLVTLSISNSIFRFDAVSGDFLGQFGIGDQTSIAAAVIGPDGLLYVGGFDSNDIERYDPSTGARIDTFVTAGAGGLNQAAGIAFGVDGNLYVASHATDQVLRYNGETGDFIDVFIDATGGLDGPIGLLFHSNGDLYVSSYNTNRVIRYDGETGAVVGDFVGAANGGLSGPELMAFGPDGNLYVTSYATDEVLRYDGDTGAYIDTFVGAGVGTLDGPVGIAFGPDGNLYVGSELSNQILRYDGDTGAFLDVYASGSGLNGARDTVFSPTVQVTVTAPPNGGQFWFSTDGNGSSSSLGTWDKGTVIELGGSGLSFDPAGSPADTTSGDMTVAFDIENFASGADLSALHYVGTDITIGGDSQPAFNLQSGDVLFTVNSNQTLTSSNSVDVDKNDVVVFRADSAGDYSSGTFFLLLDDFMGVEVRGITLVEQDVDYADTTIAAGTFLYVRSGGSQDSNIYTYVADDVGDGITSGTSQLLIDGADIGITDKLIGIELIEQPIDVAGTSLAEGNILLTLDGDDDVGDNVLSVQRQDVFVLDITQTTLGSGTAAANATLLIDGSDIDLTDSDESIDAIALFSNNSSPTDITLSNLTVDENTDTDGGHSVGTLTATDVDAGDEFSWSIVGGADAALFSIGGAGANELILDDGVLDYENETAYDVIISVMDSGGNLLQKPLTVTVNDLNDNTPTIDASQAFSVAENAANNHSLGTVTASDPDSVGGLTNWSITDGNGDGIFSINSSTGELTILDNSNLDRESTASYTLTVQVEDGANTSSTETIEITVNDVNDNAPVVTGSQTFNVNED